MYGCSFGSHELANNRTVSKNDEIPQPDDPNSLADLHPPSALPIIVRATNGKSKEKHKDRVKISTVVRPEELETFYTRYAEVCKSGMQQLKKRDRKTRKKAKAKKRKEAEAEK